jgi:glycosyltransferase involved in cell wall biosynthesis
MRVCIVYDCLYPHTVGGAERWYRNLAERLAAEGHRVTYLTLRQWPRGGDAGVAGVTVVPVGPRMALYVKGRRRILPPVVFGIGVLWHLLVHGRRYDVVHSASFPYFSVLAIAAARALHRFRVIVDWHEVWSRDYWREYLGHLGGIGTAVQHLCARIGDQAFCFSRLHAARLHDEGFRGPISVLEGEYAGGIERAEAHDAEPVVVFAGRHIPEKRVPAIPAAVRRARERLPLLRAEVYGDGPDRPELLRAIAAEGLDDAIAAPGFVDGDTVDRALTHALCMLLPSRREGYGMVVVEASARGTPSVVVDGPDNAAVELVDDGRNGFVASSADPAEIADAIVRVHDAGPALRDATAEWFNDNARRLSLDSSLDTVVERYRSR